MIFIKSLWGEAFNTSVPAIKKTINKVNNAKEVSSVKTVVKKSKQQSLKELIEFIKSEVYRILGKYKSNTIVIYKKEDLHNYISKAIKNGELAVDTETNNSLDPITCKIMGLCLYTPGKKQAYVPINHVNIDTKERLSNQLTETDIQEELLRLDNTTLIFHNGKFDYQVLKCTTGACLNITWDTMIAAKMLNENEDAKLKWQYIDKIDNTIEKYSITHLFNKIEYAILEPELFALYAATDAFMTYKLYKWQQEQFNRADNSRVYWVFKNVEMPVVSILAEVELYGVQIDIPYANRLQEKYKALSEQVELEIQQLLNQYLPEIQNWRQTAEANFHPISSKPNKNGEYKAQKSKNEQLNDPPQLSSNTQLAILLYDVFKIPCVDTENPRGTGEEILVKINHPLTKLIMRKRELDKLRSTYIDAIPSNINPKDNKIHTHYNQIGAACITKDSFIVTDTGVCTIDKVSQDWVANWPTEFNTQLLNENNELELTSHKVMYTTVPTIRIICEGGYELEGTFNHPVRVVKNNNLVWKQLLDITLQDEVIIDATPYPFNQPVVETNFERPIKYTKPSRMPKYFNEQFANFLGITQATCVYSELTNNARITFNKSKKEAFSRWVFLSQQLFGLTPRKKDIRYIQDVKLKIIKPFIINDEQIIPDIILQSKDTVFNAFLKGYSIKSINNKPNAIYFFKHIKDAEAVKLRLLKQGIICYISYKDSEYQVIIAKESYNRFNSLIGTPYGEQASVDIPTFNYSIYNNNPHLLLVKVIHIQNSNNDVYDFTLPKTHSFQSNGFISHNTGRFSSNSPNLQNIPAKEKSIRMMFQATNTDFQVEEQDNCFVLNKWDKVETTNGFIFCNELNNKSILITNEGNEQVQGVKIDKNKVFIYT